MGLEPTNLLTASQALYQLSYAPSGPVIIPDSLARQRRSSTARGPPWGTVQWMPSPLPPPTRRSDHVDTYHGESVPDPYRWLEDTSATETVEWIAAQNRHTESWLAAVPTRPAIRERLAQLWDYERVGVPFERGGRWFQSRNSGLQNQAVLYVMDAPTGPGRVLLDPNGLSEDGTVAVTGLSVTDDGSLLAYSTSVAGSDWMTWHVRDVETGRDRDERIEWSKFSGAAWRHDASGFYYGAPPAPAPGAEYVAETGPMRIFFHHLGSPQSEDVLVFGTPDEPEWVHNAEVTEDGRFLVISTSRGTGTECDLRILDHDAPERGLRSLVSGLARRAVVVGNVAMTFYLLTDDGAKRQRIVAVNLEHSTSEHWREIVPEQDALLADAYCFGDHLVCHHLEDACSRLSVRTMEGELRAQIELPAVATVAGELGGAGLEGRAQRTQFHFALTSFVDPGSLWEHDLVRQETRQLRASAADFDTAAVISEQVFVRADDGAAVPLFVTHRREVAPNGDVPALLYGYGGFDISMTPAFSRSNALFVERGGVLAVAALRGGGEYGRAWHDAGRLANKQRVFDDFCDCARYLASSGWSRPERIAINGGSNGGLLVGACLTQHPELFGAAVPEVGVLDMLRFHRFTIGWAWKSDYGDPDDPEQYGWVRAYSPLHHVTPNTAYPPTLVMTGDHDDRVVPGHSFKFAATLQAAQDAERGGPILIRIETSAGHGAGKPTGKAIAERGDVLAFLDATIGGAGFAADAEKGQAG